MDTASDGSDGSDVATDFEPVTEHPWQRLHPLSPLLRGGLVLVVIAGIIIANFRDRLISLVVAEEYIGGGAAVTEADVFDYLVEADLLLLAMLVCLGVIILCVVIAWVIWRFHTYRITAEVVEERSGVVFRQHRRAPLERIQSVNLQRPLIARLLGLTQLEIQTAGQGGKVTLSYLGFQTAKDVREDILQRAARSRDLAATPSVGKRGLRNGAGQLIERRAAEIFDADVDAAAVDTGSIVSVPVGRLIGSIALSWDLWVPVLLVLASIVSAILWDPFFLTMIIPAAFITVAVVFTSFNRGFRFTLSGTSEGVRIGAGLTATTTESIPFGRIHAIEARQPLGWRPCGWWKVRITTAGHGLAQGGQNKLQNLVLPVGTLADVERVFATLMPGSADSERQLSALHHGLLGSGDAGGYVPAGSRAPWVLWFGARRAGIRVDHGEQLTHTSLRMRRGAMNRSLIVLPLVRAQSLQLQRPFAQRALGLATITAHTVLGPVQVYLRGLELDSARGFFSEVETAMLAVQNHDARSHLRKRSHNAAHYRSGRCVFATPVLTHAPPVFPVHVPTSNTNGHSDG